MVKCVLKQYVCVSKCVSKMAITIRPIIRDTEKRIAKDGKCPIEICITAGRSRIYIKTGRKIEPENWGDGKIIKSYPNSVLLNGIISKRVNEIDAEILKREMAGQIITPEIIKAICSNKTNSVNFYEYANMVLQEMEDLQKNKEETRRLYKIQREKLKDYAPNLTITDISPEWLTKYQKHLLLDGDSNNYTIQAFKLIRIICGHAFENKVITYYPFDDWTFPAYKSVDKSYLVESERQALKDLLVKNKLSGTLQLITAFFLLECYSGIRHSDWHKFKVEKIVDDEQFYLSTTKTKERISIPLAYYPDLKWIVDYIRDHDLSYKLSLEEANRTLKSVQILAGIDKKLTTHIGRHTAGTMLLELGLSIEEVALQLGVSKKVVETYAKITGLKLKLAYKRLQLK